MYLNSKLYFKVSYFGDFCLTAKSVKYKYKPNISVLQYTSTVLPVKSDSDVMFCLQSYQGLIIDRIKTQVIYRLALAQVEFTS